MSAELFELFAGDCVARYGCGGTLWEILVDKPGEFDKFTGIRCEGCGEVIEFKMKILDRSGFG